jgi:hypothetical protein
MSRKKGLAKMSAAKEMITAVCYTYAAAEIKGPEG